MKERERQTAEEAYEAGLSGPLLEEVLAAHLFNADQPEDLGLEFEDEAPPPSSTPAGKEPGERTETSPASQTEAGPTPQLGPELSDDELAFALGWPSAASPWNEPAPIVRKNRRGAARHALSTRAMVGISSGDTETVQLRNLSTGGVCALHSRPLRRGETFRITLRSPSAHAASLARTIERRCIVLRCEAGGTGMAMYRIAAQFVA